MQFLTRILEGRWLLYIGLATLAVGLPLSRALVSIGPGILIGAWVFDTIYRKNLRQKWQAFLQHRVALLFAGIFLVYVLGCLWSADAFAGIKIISNKLPLLFLILIFSSWRSIGAQNTKIIMGLHLVALLLSTILSYTQLAGMSEGVDPRDALLFVNHIRLSLMIVLAIGLIAYKSSSYPTWAKLMALGLICWFGYFMSTFQMATGLGLLVLLLLAGGIALVRHSDYRKWIGFASVLLSIAVIGYLGKLAYEQFDKPSIDNLDVREVTALGAPYSFDFDNKLLENGEYVWCFVAKEEMRDAWNQRSVMKIDPSDPKGVILEGGLIRYLTSRGLRKDAAGVAQLTALDIKRIESGHPSIAYAEFNGIRKRLYMLLYEIDAYLNEADPSLSSLTIKWEYWRTGLQVIEDHPWTGVGTGDVRNVFEEYQAREGKIAPDAYDKAHNQYITWLATFGIFGGVLVLLAFLGPLYLRKGIYDRYIIYLVYGVFLASFITEDTFENQLGLNLFLFYAVLFLLPCEEEARISA